MAPEQEVLTEQNEDENRRSAGDHGQVLATMLERVVAEHEKEPGKRENEILSKQASKRRQSQNPAEISIAPPLDVAQRKRDEQQVKQKPNRVGLELLRKIDRARIERDHGNEEKSRRE